ncbi:MAG: hypothetical protein IKE04_05660 [Oscillospiraceae bacterium]|nr:hypothetical protein [Oscillospiraceae bacterium]
MAVNTKYSYEDFRQAVKEMLKDCLRVWKLTPEALEAYMKQEEDQIKSAYDGYAEDLDGGVRDGRRTEDQCFQFDASTVAYCLELCY